MKKILLLLILLPDLAMSQNVTGNKVSLQDKFTSRDSAAGIGMNTQSGQQLVKLDSASTVAILQQSMQPKDTSWWKWFFPLLISIIALTVTVQNRERDKRYRDLAFLSEIDKMLINDPELWGIYDKYKTAKFSQIVVNGQTTIDIKNEAAFKISDPGSIKVTGKGEYSFDKADMKPVSGNSIAIDGEKLLYLKGDLVIETNAGSKISFESKESLDYEGKIRAFAYYKLNNFELALPSAAEYNEERTASWESYIQEVIIKSEVFRGIVLEAIASKIYNQSFREKLIVMIKKAGFDLQGNKL